MAVWFVSRHQGALDWVATQGITIDYFVTHLAIEQIRSDDVVIGTLPIHLAAEVCAKGAKFYFLSVNVQFEQRGTELTCEQLIQQGCSLQQFYVQKI